jgi:hypothetical protein
MEKLQMGMSTSVVGIKPVDEKWKQMKTIWDLCHQANIEAPDEVYEFFGEEGPDPAGVIVYRDGLNGAVQKYEGEYESGLEVHIDMLPKDVKIIRFTNSW